MKIFRIETRTVYNPWVVGSGTYYIVAEDVNDAIATVNSQDIIEVKDMNFTNVEISQRLIDKMA